MGGYFDKEFETNTVPFFDRVIKGDVKIILSDLLEAELLRAPEFVKELLVKIPNKSIEKVRLSTEATELAENISKPK